MGPFTVNTKAAVITFGVLATNATGGTYTQLPNVVCDEVVIGQPPTVSITVAGSATPAGAFVTLLTTAPLPLVLKTGGNLSNLWIANVGGSASQNVGYQTVQYKPIT